MNAADPSGHLSLAWNETPPEDWGRLIADAEGASFAAQPGWLESFRTVQPACQLRILTIRRGDRLVGGVPAVITRRWRRRWLRSLPFGTYGGPLVSRAESNPGEVRGQLASAMARFLEEEKIAGGEIVHAPLVANSQPYPEWQALSRMVTQGHAHVVDLAAGVETVESNLKRETRKGFRRAEREEVRVEEDPTALTAVYQFYRAQSRQWRGHRPYDLGFLESLLQHPSGFARFFVARARGELQAGVLALSGGGETFLWWSGATPSARRTQAFPYLLFQTLRSAAQRGERRVNIGSSGGSTSIERFKWSLGAEPRPLWIYHLRAHPSDLLARALGWARAARRRV